MWYHLERIEFYSSNSFSLFEIKNKELWPYLWGSFFSLLHIDELFTRTKIIHISQSLISFFIIYFTSSVIIRNLYKNIEPLSLKYLSLWSVFIWFTIYATFSVSYHQVWILWYSINYQITLLFFWYIIALTLIIFLENPLKQKILFYLFQIFIFSILILWMHASEFIYVLMYLFLIFTIYIKNIYSFLKKYYILSIIIGVLITCGFYYFITGDYIYRKPPLFNYLHLDYIHQLYPELLAMGNKAVNHYSRASASLNELIFLSIVLLILMGIHAIYKNYIHHKPINFKLYFFLLISALFVYIPINVITAGISSLLFAPTYVNRFYYTSSIFIVLPIVTYYFLSRKNIWIINFVIGVTIVSTLLYSKHISSSHNYYKNFHSIIQSFKRTAIGFNLSDSQINVIGKKIKNYEKINTFTKENYYYARDDIALVIKFIYKKPVLWKHRGNHNYKKSFHQHNNTLFHPVLFEIPTTFSKYKRYK